MQGPGERGETWKIRAISSQLLYTAREAGKFVAASGGYYEESELIWLDARYVDSEKTGSKKSLDDFCRAFHGGESGEPKLIPYTLDERGGHAEWNYAIRLEEVF